VRKPSLRSLFLLLALSTAALHGSRGGPGPNPGAPAPEFELQDTAGKTVRLSSLRGEVVVLHFWATWCPHCLTEIPLLEKLIQEPPFQGVRVLAINLGEPQKKVSEYLRAHPSSLPVVLDSRGKVAEAYGVLGLPASVVVDASGRMAREIAMGSLSREELEKVLASVARGDGEGRAGK